MKIAIIGASGHVGNMITAEALDRRHEVTAIVRHPERLTYKIPVIAKDLFTLTTEDLKPFEIVVDAYKAPQGEEETYVSSTDHLLKIMKPLHAKLYIVGGAGSLYTDESKKMHVYEAPGFPAFVKPTSANMWKSIEHLRQQDNVQWTYLCPSADFIFSKTHAHGGHYRLGGEVLLTSKRTGKSEVTTADYAVAMLDEIEDPQHLNERYTVVSE